MSWLNLAWVHRDTIVAFGRKLKLPLRTWLRLAGVVVVGAVVYGVVTYGYADRFNPTYWSPGQWAQLLINVVGFGILYMAQRVWWNRQDAVWDDVELLRGQLDELREKVFTHEHEAAGEDDEFVPDSDPSTIDAIPSARPSPVRVEVPTVERELGGRKFNFKS